MSLQISQLSNDVFTYHRAAFDGKSECGRASLTTRAEWHNAASGRRQAYGPYTDSWQGGHRATVGMTTNHNVRYPKRATAYSTEAETPPGSGP